MPNHFHCRRNKAGVQSAGNFVKVMEAYLLRRGCGLQDGEERSKQLTVGAVNGRLNDLAATDSREQQVGGPRVPGAKQRSIWQHPAVLCCCFSLLAAL
jgi:hypothetical protein